MSACRYRVISIGIEPNVRGVPMRRLILRAQPSEPFGAAADSPAPDGVVSQLVTEEWAQRFSVGDEFDVSFRERQAD